MKRKHLLTLLLVLIPNLFFSESFHIDGVWYMYSGNPSIPFSFYTKNYFWGTGKIIDLPWSPLEIDTGNNFLCNYSDLLECTILMQEKVDDRTERVQVYREADKCVYNLLFIFLSESKIQVIDEATGMYPLSPPNHPNPNTFYRISGPARIPVKNAVLNDSRVRCRTEPNLNCETWGYLNTGDKVLIKDISDAPFEIDGESWYWYKVESDILPDGWVYGKYLDIEE